MASFHKYSLSDGSTKWRVAYRKHDGSQGNKRGFRTKRAAQTWWNENAAKLSSEASSTPPLSHYWDRVLTRHADWKPSTLVIRQRSYEMDVKPRWGDIEAGAVRPSDVQDWLTDELAPRYTSPTPIQARLTVLRMLLAEARRDGAIEYDPTADAVVRPGKSRADQDTDMDRAQDIITWDQVELIIDQCVYQPYKDLIRLLAATGMRWGEATALRPGDIDLDKRRIHIRRTVGFVAPGVDPVRLPKTGKTRTVAFPASLVPVLERRVAEAGGPDAWLFPSPRGTYIKSPGAASWFGIAIRAARKIDPTIPATFHPHSLRHTAVSRWISEGVPMKVIAHQVGHANPSTTERIYTHLMPDSLDQIADLDPAAG